MANILSRVFGTRGGRDLRVYQARLKDVEAFTDGFTEASDEELQAASATLKERAAAGESLDDLLPEAFALVREASERTIGLRHYDVQLIGAMALHDGKVAEMATGEGKTLVATAAAYLNALPGNQVHIVTANDYLARRDAEWMGPLYAFLGLRANHLSGGMQPLRRMASYSCDVVYATGSELAFDYLRDNMAFEARQRLQGGHRFAIVDEADSVLIDEARTPLVISGQAGSDPDLYARFAEIAAMLGDGDVVIDEAKRLVYATEEGLDKVEAALGREVYSDASGELANHLRQALRARFLYERNVDYVVADGKASAVDELTGRVLEGRRYGEGLHQAIEAKEGLDVGAESTRLATVSVQNYFRLYAKLAGMTGTAMTEDREFKDVYGMRVVAIPTNSPVARVDEPDYVYRTAEAKFEAVADEVAYRHGKGQPVLVGTTSVKDSDRLGALLDERGVVYRRLDAKDHEDEAHVIAQAGRVGAVTVVASMAGRGTDIHLGGNWEAVRDEFLRRRFTADFRRLQDWQMEAAEDHAAYVTESEGYSVRVDGGLCVIGTARHESRRGDMQLRGRAGRQGDPGESRFYLSMEDELFTRFGGDRLKAVSEMMERRGLGGVDSPIEDEAVGKVLDAAQKEMEALSLGTRKWVLDFDDVLNRQRLAIYKERNAILDGEKRPHELLHEVISEISLDTVQAHCPYSDPSDDWDYDALCAWYEQMTGENASFLRSADHDEDPDALAAEIAAALEGLLVAKRESMGTDAFEGLARMSMLRMIDSKWVLHLQEMERLRQGIMLRAIGRRDPLLEFKEESYEAFGELVASVYEEWLNLLLRYNVMAGNNQVAEPSAGEQITATRGEESVPTADFSPVTDNPLG